MAQQKNFITLKGYLTFVTEKAEGYDDSVKINSQNWKINAIWRGRCDELEKKTRASSLRAWMYAIKFKICL